MKLASHSPDAQPNSLLKIEELDDILPLDDQRGVWPQKNVPDAIQKALFGSIRPTADEIAQYGDLASVPPMQTYIVLDAAKLQTGFSEIEDCELPFRCLFKGKAAQDLKDAAPYLIELDPENRFTRTLFQHIPDMPETMTSVHLWQKEPGIFIRTRSGFDDLWKHLRKFPRLRDVDDQWYFFQFWEPRVLRDYLYDIRFEAGKIMNWFGRRAAALTIITLAGGILRSHTLAEDIPALQKAEPIQLERTALARQHARRTMTEFARAHKVKFDWSNILTYQYPWQEFTSEDLKIAVLLHGFFGISDKYDHKAYNPAATQYEKQQRLTKLLFFKEQKVPYGL